MAEQEMGELQERGFVPASGNCRSVQDINIHHVNTISSLLNNVNGHFTPGRFLFYPFRANAALVRLYLLVLEFVNRVVMYLTLATIVGAVSFILFFLIGVICRGLINSFSKVFYSLKKKKKRFCLLLLKSRLALLRG